MKFSRSQLKAVRARIKSTSYRKLAKSSGLTVSELYSGQANSGRDYRVATLKKYAAMCNMPLWLFMLLPEIDAGLEMRDIEIMVTRFLNKAL